ncbi:MAG: hypothetical protein AAF298_14690 [Cyanobacteria bacterium P01_A01_bin.40]
MLDFATKQKQSQQFSLGIETILSLIAIALTISIFLKVILDIDNNYDPGWYHLPFAGRLGGILPKSMFIGDEKWFEPRFEGFPLLAHTLQGFFWRITGRLQSTNLVSFLAIVGYWFFLRTYFKIPLYLSAIALLAIPLVLTHTSTSFVDLLGNVGTSILVMMTYSWFKNKQLPATKELIFAFTGAAIAANTKTQLQPLVLVILAVIVLRLAWLYWQQKFPLHFLKILPIALLATMMIFATPVKNTVLYGNPLYPIKLEVAGVVLNHKLSPEAYESGNRQLNWVQSVLEVNAPLFWTPDQWSGNPERNRRGGFFGAYVVFNLLLLGVFFLQELLQNRTLAPRDRTREARTACLTAIAMSIVPLNFPQSHELRYFMYWMICLVSLNLYLISLPKNQHLWGRWLQPKYAGLIYAVFLTIVLIKTNGIYVRPSMITLDRYVNFGVKSDLLSQIKPESKVCLLSRHIGEDIQTTPIVALKYAYLYSSYFHPEIDYDYSIRAALNAESCGDRAVIPDGIDLKNWR